jgi:hypothetical protein
MLKLKTYRSTPTLNNVFFLYKLESIGIFTMHIPARFDHIWMRPFPDEDLIAMPPGGFPV